MSIHVPFVPPTEVFDRSSCCHKKKENFTSTSSFAIVTGFYFRAGPSQTKYQTGHECQSRLLFYTYFIFTSYSEVVFFCHLGDERGDIYLVKQVTDLLSNLFPMATATGGRQHKKCIKHATASSNKQQR